MLFILFKPFNIFLIHNFILLFFNSSSFLLFFEKCASLLFNKLYKVGWYFSLNKTKKILVSVSLFAIFWIKKSITWCGKESAGSIELKGILKNES